jgi:hypothetical protein
MSTLLAPWLQERDAVALVRNPAVDTSLFVLGLALAVAGGRGVSGWQAPRALHALYVNDRDDLKRTLDRLDILGPAVRPAADNDTLTRLHIVTPDAALPNLATPNGRRELVETVKLTRAALVVLDCAAPLDLLRSLRDLGAAVVLTIPSDHAARFPTGTVHRFVMLKPMEPHGLALSFAKPGGIADMPVRIPGVTR